MKKPCILCLDDQPEVGAAVEKDLAPLTQYIDILVATSGAEAWDILEEIDSQNIPLLVIISDHVMPEQTGVEFLHSVVDDGRFKPARHVLLTGLATHEDTIAAINEGHIDHYLSKPWEADKLLEPVQRFMTQAIFDYDLDFRAFGEVLDETVVMQRLSQGSDQ